MHGNYGDQVCEAHRLLHLATDSHAQSVRDAARPDNAMPRAPFEVALHHAHCPFNNTSAFGASGLMFGWHVHATDSGTAPP